MKAMTHLGCHPTNIQDLHMLITEMDDRIEQIRNTCTPETGMDDIKTEREAFNASISTLRVTTEEAMRGLGDTFTEYRSVKIAGFGRLQRLSCKIGFV